MQASSVYFLAETCKAGVALDTPLLLIHNVRQDDLPICLAITLQPKRFKLETKFGNRMLPVEVTSQCSNDFKFHDWSKLYVDVECWILNGLILPSG